MLKSAASLFFPSLISIYCCAQVTVTDRTKVTEYFQNQQFEEAVNYLAGMYNADSSNIIINNYLGYAHFMLEEYKAATDNFQRSYSIDSNNLTANRYLAILATADDPDQSLNFYQRLIRFEPTLASYYRKAGELWLRKNNPDSARLYFASSYRLSPRDPKNGTAFAALLIGNKEYNLADSILGAGLKIDSMNNDYLRLQVKSAYESQHYSNVMAPGEKLLLLRENSVTTISQILLSYYNLKYYKDCIRVCEYAQQEQIITESIYYYEARCYAKLLDFEKSNELLRTCLDNAISKTAGLYYYNLGENYEAMRNYKVAIAQYDTGYYLFRNPVLLYNCGRIMESKIKNIPRAKNYYTRYLKAAVPANEEERKAINYVRRRVGGLK